MISYFILYLIPLALAFSWSSRTQGFAEITQYKEINQNLMPWILIGILFSVAIGYRFEVGGDWGQYLRHFQAMSYFTVEDIVKRADPGYYLINWFMLDWGFEMFAVNLICGGLFMIGLIVFSRRQPNPWLALAVSVPYLIVVIAMGYTRQAVALGLVFWGLAALEKQHFKQFLLLMIVAATFHKSAVLMIGLGVFLQGQGKVFRVIAVVFVGFGIYNAFLADYQDDLWKNYVEVQMQSQGAIIRVTMNLLPALIFLLYRKEWKKEFNDYSFWFIIAIGSILSVGIVNFASTAVDRVALYFIPIQVVVFSRLPFLLRNKVNPHTVTIGILLFYLLVLYVWLNYATHAQYWVPYNNALFDDIF